MVNIAEPQKEDPKPDDAEKVSQWIISVTDFKLLLEVPGRSLCTHSTCLFIYFIYLFYISILSNS